MSENDIFVNFIMAGFWGFGELHSAATLGAGKFILRSAPSPKRHKTRDRSAGGASDGGNRPARSPRPQSRSPLGRSTQTPLFGYGAHHEA